MAKRGNIVHFTPEARMRLLVVIHSIDWPALGKSLFVTLTYPDEAVEHALEKKTQDRTLFLRAVEKAVGRPVPALWRIEWKKRRSGALKGKVMPHFHILLGGVDYLDHRTVRSLWRTIVQCTGPLCTDVQGIENPATAAFYVGKYTSKLCSLDLSAYLDKIGSVGRHWGLTRAKLFPWLPLVHHGRLTTEQAAQLRAFIAKLMPAYHADEDRGATVFGQDAVNEALKIMEEPA